MPALDRDSQRWACQEQRGELSCCSVEMQSRPSSVLGSAPFLAPEQCGFRAARGFGPRVTAARATCGSQADLRVCLPSAPVTVPSKRPAVGGLTLERRSTGAAAASAAC